MPTVALEFVPPDLEGGPERAQQEAGEVAEGLRAAGLEGRVNALLVPGMIAEEEDRPVPLRPKMDPLDVCRAVAGALPGLECIVTQVTAFSDAAALEARLRGLHAAGIRRAVFVGVPRTMADGQGPGVAPAEALGRFRELVPGRGVVLIPTRDAEKPRFEAKLAAGADFALTQLLFSDRIAKLLPTVDAGAARPEVLLSFGYVPRAETRVGLIRWLIRDRTQAARSEMAFVAELAELPFAAKKTALVELYRRIAAGLAGAGFPLGLHFECPYGFNPWAFEVFAAIADAGLPG